MAFISDGVIPYDKDKYDLFFVLIEQSLQETFAETVGQVRYDGYMFFIAICTKNVLEQPEEDFGGTLKRASLWTRASETGF